MTCPSTHSARKILLLVVLTVLPLVLWAGLMMTTPAVAQGPEDAPEVVQLDSQAPMPALQIDYEAISPADDVPTSENTGYLQVYVYDQLSGRPLGNRKISIYDRSGERVAQTATPCQGYVAFDNLPGGAYLVTLETDPDWITSRRYNSPGGRNTPGEWVWVRPNWRVAVRFYELPRVAVAGLRVYAYDSNSRQANRRHKPLAEAAFTVYDANGNFVANGITGCGGFVDFSNLASGSYRVVDANEAEGEFLYPPSGEQWVSLRFGTLTSTWFFTVRSPGPRATPTTVP